MSEDTETVDPAVLIGELADMAKDHQGERHPLVAGTFVMYPMDNGGIMVVTTFAEGPMAGTTQHAPLPPALLRAIIALAGGGSKMSKLKALAGFGRRELPSAGE